MNNTFEISGRIGHLEQSGKTLRIALYNGRAVRGQNGATEFKQQRVLLVTFGPKAEEFLNQHSVGHVVKLSGFIRASQRGVDLVVVKHEQIVKAEASSEELVAETAPEPAAEVQPEVEAAPKKSRGRKKAVVA